MQETGARQLSSTAYPYLFTLVLSVDHTTGATGKTPAVKLSKNGAAGVSAVGAVTEVDSVNMPGLYALAGNATDRNVLGPCAMHITATGCDVKDAQIDIVSYDPFQSINTGTTTFINPVNATATEVDLIAGDAYMAADASSLLFPIPAGTFNIGSQVTFSGISQSPQGTQVQKVGSVISAAYAQIELTEIESNNFISGKFSAVGVLAASGKPKTIAQGTLKVTRVPR